MRLPLPSFLAATTMLPYIGGSGDLTAGATQASSSPCRQGLIDKTELLQILDAAAKLIEDDDFLSDDEED